MEAKRVFLLPGEYMVSKQPHLIATLLGSCVSVCLYNEKLGFGGMNHYLLPEPKSEEHEIGRFGTTSIGAIVNLMKRLDPSGYPLKAMVFGGAAVVSAISAGRGIGAGNIDVARQVLADEGIRIVKEQVGGEYGLKLHYQNWDNTIQVRRVEKSQTVQQISEKKQAIASRGKIRVLVVDDAPLVRRIISQQLARTGEFEVVGEAQDAFEARQMLVERQPDVMTLDIIMPKMDGVSFLRRVMKHLPVPTIIISTIAQKGSRIRDRAFAAGAVDVLDKEDLSLYGSGQKVSTMLADMLRKAAHTPVRKRA